MQEQTNGFKRIIQKFGNYFTETTINQNEVTVRGADTYEFRGALKTNGLIEGAGLYNYMVGVQPLYLWTTAMSLSAYSVSDSVLLYSGSSSVKTLNPFARIYKEDFENCVIWPVKLDVFGNGFDYDNNIAIGLKITGTHWMKDDSTGEINVGSCNSYRHELMDIANNFPFKADSSDISIGITDYYASGTPLDSDHNFFVRASFICQKVEL